MYYVSFVLGKATILVISAKRLHHEVLTTKKICLTTKAKSHHQDKCTIILSAPNTRRGSVDFHHYVQQKTPTGKSKQII